MDPRFSRNIPGLTEAEQTLLGQKRVLVAGCGGLGGYLIELLTRAGVGAITAADGDTFDESNLNRQLNALAATLGQSKARCAAARALAIRPDMEFRPLELLLTPETLPAALEGVDLAVDALDSAEARLWLEDACAAKGISLVHGAVEGWVAQIGVSAPGSGLLHSLYAGRAGAGSHTEKPSVLSPTVAVCAAMECAEALKLLCGRPSLPAGSLAVMDLRSMDLDILPMNG